MPFVLILQLLAPLLPAGHRLALLLKGSLSIRKPERGQSC